MSFQAYLDTIAAKTGQPASAIADRLGEQGFEKPGQMIAWLKTEYGLGHGHAMAVVSLLRGKGQPERTANDKAAAYFTGAKATWRDTFDRLAQTAHGLGPDVAVSPGATYLSLVKAGRKFAIVQAVGQRLDLGLKLKGEPAAGRLEAAGTWNSMVTHRVRITDPAELDAEVSGWLAQAYAGA